MQTIILLVLLLIFASLAIFLGREFLKKFLFFKKFIENSDQMKSWKFPDHQGQAIGMKNIVLRSNCPFCVLIGFKLEIPLIKYTGFDYYGFAQSDEDNKAVISVYIGKGNHEQQFFFNCSVKTNPITISSNESDQKLKSQVVYPPHWYQRVGFYG